MDKQTLTEYKFMDTPEFRQQEGKSMPSADMVNWLFNNFKRSSD